MGERLHLHILLASPWLISLLENIYLCTETIQTFLSWAFSIIKFLQNVLSSLENVLKTFHCGRLGTQSSRSEARAVEETARNRTSPRGSWLKSLMCSLCKCTHWNTLSSTGDQGLKDEAWFFNPHCYAIILRNPQPSKFTVRGSWSVFISLFPVSFKVRCNTDERENNLISFAFIWAHQWLMR